MLVFSYLYLKMLVGITIALRKYDDNLNLIILPLKSDTKIMFEYSKKNIGLKGYKSLIFKVYSFLCLFSHQKTLYFIFLTLLACHYILLQYTFSHLKHEQTIWNFFYTIKLYYLISVSHWSALTSSHCTQDVRFVAVDVKSFFS